MRPSHPRPLAGKIERVEQSDADVLVREFRSQRFAARLRVVSAEVVGLPQAPLLLVYHVDEHHPAQRLGAWWDFYSYERFIDDHREMAWLASHAKIYLEELFEAGGPVAERPKDGDGVAWGELDWRGEHRLPPRERG